MVGKTTKMFVILAGVLVLWLASTGSIADTGVTGVPDPCESTATGAGGCMVVCPSGDADRLEDIGAIVTVVIKDAQGLPIAGVPTTDIWLQGCTNGLVPGGSHFGVQTDGLTDVSGTTTISGPLEAGGYDTGLSVWVQGVHLLESDCSTLLCLGYAAKSPDISADTAVDVVDLGLFSLGYLSPPKTYQWELDFDCNRVVDLVDFSLFSLHYLHT